MDSKNKIIGTRRPICIVDYGMGNVTSVEMAFQALRVPCQVSRDVDDIVNSNGLVLPGVGAFRIAMENLKRLHLLDAIDEAVNERKTPFLGICLGMQLLATTGYEPEQTEGLGLIPGEVKLMNPSLRLPHVGWNGIDLKKPSKLFVGVKKKSDFYFVHSYHFLPFDNNVIIASTDYGVEFVSCVNINNIYGIQFHPEKSQKQGLKILKNYVDLLNA